MMASSRWCDAETAPSSVWISLYRSAKTGAEAHERRGVAASLSSLLSVQAHQEEGVRGKDDMTMFSSPSAILNR